jgi:hypothetical protein
MKVDRQALDRADADTRRRDHVRERVEKTQVRRLLDEMEVRDRKRLEDRRAERKPQRLPRFYETRSSRPKSPVTLPTKPFDWRRD